MIESGWERDRLERFRAVVERRLGLSFAEARDEVLADALSRRGGHKRADVDAYVRRLEEATGDDELAALVSLLTVGETYFFRHTEQFRALERVVFAGLARSGAAERGVRILSVGCASGEEAYSLAISARQNLPSGTPRCTVLGVDVNGDALRRAATGRYSSWSLRGVSEETRERWFRPAGREYVLDPAVVAAVRFERKNLADPGDDLWIPRSYDVVFFRNVLMYLTPDAARSAVAGISRALVAGGHLFLGHAETLRGLSHDFELRHAEDAFFYQRRDALLVAELSSGDLARARLSDPPATTDDGTWLGTVSESLNRLRLLGATTNAEAPTPAPARARARGDLASAMELLRAERFDEALSLLTSLPDEARQDPDVLLLRAALLTHSGQLEAAERACSELSEQDATCAGAHYLLALCRESAGDREGAKEHDLMAAYLDPAFAMPHLHLGLLARKTGDLREARRELKEALALLDREDASRVLLYGGGFTRETLARLCHAELLSTEGGAR